MTSQHYPIEPGFHFADEYPGDRNPEMDQDRIFNLAESSINLAAWPLII